MLNHDRTWDERYAAPEFVFGEQPNAFLRSCAPRLRPGMRALALADGEGRNGVWLAQQGLDVVSVDISARGQQKALDLAARRGVAMDVRLADLAHWDWPENEFDLVAAIFIQFAGPEFRDRMFGKIKRTLKPGGLLLLEGYRPEQLEYGTGGPPVAENMYTPAMLRDAFSDFEILDLRAYDADIQEGVGHSGISALIDLVARKPGSDADRFLEED